jgi:putative spermidine/putrescine transport system permease protein
MRGLFLVLVTAIFVFLLAPLVIVLAVSVNPGSVAQFPPTGLSLRWYVQALQSDLFRGAMINSLLLAAASALVSTVIGTAAALALVRARFPGKPALEALLLSPLVVPGIVLGIALLAGFAAIGFRDALWRLLLAHVLLTLPYCIRTVMISLQRLDPVLEQAAETLGASAWRVFAEVTLPLIRPGMLAGGLFAFVMSFDNVPVSVFLTSAETTTLPLAIISYLEYNFDPSVAAISSVLIILMLLLALLLERVAGLRRTLTAAG